MASRKKGPGRPRKSSATKKSESVLLRLSEKEKEVFQGAADVAGIPLAVWMRERLRRVAVAEFGEIDRKNPFLD
jgi:hypothetical protein